jgi:hypothetical protein
MNDRAKSPRTLLIADHVWDALSTMAAEMGTERDALVNQALYTFARLNGFLVPADLQSLAPVAKPAPIDSGRLRIAPPPAPDRLAEISQQLAAGMARRVSSPPALATPTSVDAGSVAEVAPPPATLVLLAEGRELDRVEKDRFLIGRGKHCDLIINSGKVSREHAAITREGQAWFIEDLGSSNGTWFETHRITRREIREGDEYFISSEKLSCSFR